MGPSQENKNITLHYVPSIRLQTVHQIQSSNHEASLRSAYSGAEVVDGLSEVIQRVADLLAAPQGSASLARMQMEHPIAQVLVVAHDDALLLQILRVRGSKFGTTLTHNSSIKFTSIESVGHTLNSK